MKTNTSVSKLIFPSSLAQNPNTFFTVQLSDYSSKDQLPAELSTYLGGITFTSREGKEFYVDFTNFSSTLREKDNKLFLDVRGFNFDPEFTTDSSTAIPLEWSQLQDSYNLNEVSLDIEYSLDSYVHCQFVEFHIVLFDENKGEYLPVYTATSEELIKLNSDYNINS